MIKNADTRENCKHGSGHRRYTWPDLGLAFLHKTVLVRRRNKKIDNRLAAMPELVWMYQGKKMKIWEIDSQRLSMKKVSGEMTFMPTVIWETC
ncbi:hypothetical protein G5S34_19315 [Herbaspirillum frisingense]|uniref:hypothetical protein n=1 Tax=Herbaspirillum frisingense TaxID=92645 RepID=UPI0015FFF831|nr:hypothetical protein [Herbaspirillum frisingense]QNB08687.1 hypothetical protein G5S34_19315 [Herbaspirillum frisingense]